MFIQFLFNFKIIIQIKWFKNASGKREVFSLWTCPNKIRYFLDIAENLDPINTWVIKMAAIGNFLNSTRQMVIKINCHLASKIRLYALQTTLYWTEKTIFLSHLLDLCSYINSAEPTPHNLLRSEMVLTWHVKQYLEDKLNKI